MAEINVTPMVDVMLVLLIIFMVITPMLTKGAAVELVKTNHPIAMKDADKEDTPKKNNKKGKTEADNTDLANMFGPATPTPGAAGGFPGGAPGGDIGSGLGDSGDGGLMGSGLAGAGRPGGGKGMAGAAGGLSGGPPGMGGMGPSPP